MESLQNQFIQKILWVFLSIEEVYFPMGTDTIDKAVLCLLKEQICIIILKGWICVRYKSLLLLLLVILIIKSPH